MARTKKITATMCSGRALVAHMPMVSTMRPAAMAIVGSPASATPTVTATAVAATTAPLARADGTITTSD